jgi:hypothetical protein
VKGGHQRQRTYKRRRLFLTHRAVTPRMLLLQVLQRSPDSPRLRLGSGSLSPGSGDLLFPNLVQTAKAIRIRSGSSNVPPRLVHLGSGCSLASCRLLGCGPGSSLASYRLLGCGPGCSLASCRLLGGGLGGGGGRLGGCEGSAEGLNLVTEIVDLSAGR